jgi:hypothetical protein
VSRRSGSLRAASPRCRGVSGAGDSGPDLSHAGVAPPRGDGGRARGLHSSRPGSSPLDALLERWRAEADVLLRRGAIDAAAALEACTAELAEALLQQGLEQLTVSEAAAESGYSASQLRKRFPGQRRIARKDLPKKGAGPDPGGPDLAGELLLERGRGRG